MSAMNTFYAGVEVRLLPEGFEEEANLGQNYEVISRSPF